MRDQNDYNVRAVERAVQILNSFDDAHPERGVSEIAEIVGLHKATTYRILATLLNYGLVERSSDNQKYRLGVHLIDLGFKVTRRMDLRRESLPYMTQMAQKLDEAVDLSVFDHQQVLYIEMLQSQHALRIAATVGQRLPAYCTASGKVFLAHLSSTQIGEYFAQQPLISYTKNTIIDPETLLKQFEAIREKGFSVDNEELELGIRAIAAPIRNRNGNIIGVISIPSPTSRLPVSRIQEVVEVLRETTGTISRRLGWHD
jgi:IclR family transcriptional regulator, KDG regulon repressor